MLTKSIGQAVLKGFTQGRWFYDWLKQLVSYPQKLIENDYLNLVEIVSLAPFLLHDWNCTQPL